MASGSGSHVLFNIVDGTHQDDPAERTVSFTRSDGRAIRALDSRVGCFSGTEAKAVREAFIGRRERQRDELEGVTSAPS